MLEHLEELATSPRLGSIWLVALSVALALYGASRVLKRRGLRRSSVICEVAALAVLAVVGGVWLLIAPFNEG